jgi:hypothetical protein
MTYEETIQKYGLTGKTGKDQINQMYDAQLAAQKSQMQTDYETADAELAAKQEQANKLLDKNITRTRTDAQRSAMNAEEYYNAAGLSSGARAQARLAQDNRLLADITTLRAAQQQADAETERQRTLLSKEYASAIAKAQADNDLARAEALYADAKEAEAKLLAKQEAAAGIMAQAGDYSRYGDLYGLSPDEIKKLGNASSSSGTGGGGVDNQGYHPETVKEVQRAIGVTDDGLWGHNSQAKAKAKYGTTDIKTILGMIGKTGSHTDAYYSIIDEINVLRNAGEIYNAVKVVKANKSNLTSDEYEYLLDAAGM